jgi:hypothetical protein
MKKALTLVLALAITLGVTGCTKKTGNPTNETSQTTVSEEKIEFDVKAAYEANKLLNLLETSESVREAYEYNGEISYTEYFLDDDGNVAFMSYMEGDEALGGSYKGFGIDCFFEDDTLYLTNYITGREEIGFNDISIAYFLDEYKVTDVKANGDFIEVEMKISEIFECEPIFVKFEKDTLRLVSYDDGVVLTYTYDDFGKKDFIKNRFEKNKITVTFIVETYSDDGSSETSEIKVKIPENSVLCPLETFEGYFAYADEGYTQPIVLDRDAEPFTDGVTIYLTNAAG